MVRTDDHPCRLPGCRQAGQTAVEYALLLAAFGLPMIFVFRWLLGALAHYYGMVTFLETLPFP